MKSQLGRSVVLNAAGSLLFYFCQAAINILVVALAGVQANGLLSTAMTIANVGLSVASYGMRTYQVSDLSRKYADRTYLTSRYITLAAAFIGCAAFAFVNSYSAQQRLIILLFTAYRLLESWSDVWHGYLQRAERMDIVGVSFGVRGLLTAGSVAGGLLLTHSLEFTLALLLALNALYVLLADIPLARKRADLAANGGGSVWALLLECAPLAVCAALNTTIASAPRYWCERILGEVALNYFTSVFLPVIILQVAVIYLFVPFITTFARLWAAKNARAYYRCLGVLFAAAGALWAVGAAGVALLGRWGLSVLYPLTPEMQDYAPLLQPLVLATVLTVLATVFWHLLTVSREMKGLVLGNAAGLAAALLASPFFIRGFGIYGAAWATIFAVGVQALALLAALLWRCKKYFAEKVE